MQKITFTPFGLETYERILHGLQSTTELLALDEKRIAELTPQAEAASLYGELANLWDRNATLRARPNLQQLLHLPLRNAANPTRNAQRDLEGLIRTYETRLTRRETLQKDLVRSKSMEKHELDRNAIEQQLLKTPCYIPDSLTFEDNGNPVINWQLSGVLMTPDANHYTNIVSDEPIKIALPDTQISVDMRTASVCITAVDPDELICDGFLSHEGEDEDEDRNDAEISRVHPHVLHAGHPCFGSFHQTVIDCVERADIESLAYTLHAFLSQANASDSAGRYWPAWLPVYGFTDRRAPTGNRDYDVYHSAIVSQINGEFKIRSVIADCYASHEGQKSLNDVATALANSLPANTWDNLFIKHRDGAEIVDGLGTRNKRNDYTWSD